MYEVGIDIGSTATKVVVMSDGEIEKTFICPTGFSSIEAAQRVSEDLEQAGYPIAECRVVATGYGRVAVPFADSVVTEITCHARGAAYLFEGNGVVIDVGGQDTKIIQLASGKVTKFVMNDKCSAGTGKFLEVMANRLVVSQDELAYLARKGSPTSISSLCTVFAESEVVALVGRGVPREDIAFGIIESVVNKVVTLAAQTPGEIYFLTGGLCENAYVAERLEKHLGNPVVTNPLARYAGALGAALQAVGLRTPQASQAEEE